MIKNKNIKGCIICQNKKLSEIIDPIIFEAKMPLKTLKEKLEEMMIFLELDQLKTHAKHVYYDDNIDYDEEFKKIKETTNLELIEKELARIEKQIEKLLSEGREATETYLRLVKMKKELLELKAKLDGEVVDKVEMKIPQWIEEIPD